MARRGCLNPDLKDFKDGRNDGGFGLAGEGCPMPVPHPGHTPLASLRLLAPLSRSERGWVPRASQPLWVPACAGMTGFSRGLAYTRTVVMSDGTKRFKRN